jgi:histidyl-tRNA synthetase
LASMEGLGEQAAELQRLCDMLSAMGVGEYLKFDFHIVRGLAYYTGVVYEVIAAGERAVAGGGRYDNLLQLVGGPAVGATGFGMGDVVLGLLLEEKGKLPKELASKQIDWFVIDGPGTSEECVLSAAAGLRNKGLITEYSFKRTGVGKQMKEANRRGAARALIIYDNEKAAIKDMTTGDQSDDAPLSDVLAEIS